MRLLALQRWLAVCPAGLALAGLCLIMACARPAVPAAGGAAAGPPSAAAAPSGGDAAPASAAPALARLRLAYGDLAPAQSPTWVGYEAGIFARYGLAVDLSYIASAQTVPAVIGGDVDIAMGGGYAAMSARLAGSDLTIFYALTNWYPYELMAGPGIETVADLRGQKVGVSRLGSSSDVATRLALRYLGLDPEREVTFVQVGSVTERAAAMQSGALAAGLASPPDPTRLRRLGFKSLLVLSEMGEEAMINVAFASEAWVRQNEATVQAFVDAMIESIHYAKTQRAYTERVIGQYTKWEDPAEIADAYEANVATNLQRVGHPSVEEGRKYLANLATTDARAVGAQPEEFFDLRFTRHAVASGLLERLYGKD